MMLNGLDLFSGIGGLTLALAPWVRPIAYCEQDRFAQCVLLSRMEDGSLPVAPIWDDVRTLSQPNIGSARIDIIYGGFPCQDISVAGNGKGLEGEQSGLFFEVARLVSEIRPRFVFLENVPAIRTRGADVVAGRLAGLGYDCRWTTLSAAEVGAPHIRNRWWLLAYANNDRQRQSVQQERELRLGEPPNFGGYGEIQHMADADSIRESQPSGNNKKCGRRASNRCFENRDAEGGQRKSIEVFQARQDADAAGNGWWSIEPDVGRTSYGLSDWLDRSRGLGHAEKAKAIRFGQILQELWATPVSQALWEATRGLDCFSAEEALLSFLRQYEAKDRESRSQLASETSPERLMRTLRESGSTCCTPLRPGSNEQYAREYPDALRELSRMVASRGQSPWNSPLWESSVQRTAVGLPHRKDRIKSLGNAVVPLCAQEAFQQLAGIK